MAKEYPYLEHNLMKISEQLKFINWNLGKLVAHQLGDTATIKKITDAEKEDAQNEKQ